MVIAGEGVLNLQGAAGPQAAHRGGLPPVVAPQAHAVAAPPSRTLPVDGQVQRGQPRLGRAGAAGIVAHALVRLPGQHQHEGHPTTALAQHLGPLTAPPRMGPGGAGCAPRGCPLGLKLRVGSAPERVCPQQPENPLLVDGHRLDDAQGGPDTAIAPNRVCGCERWPTRTQRLIARPDPQRPPPRDPQRASLCCRSRVSAPTRVCSRAGSGAQRASVRGC